jgi:hypothetical protein
VSVTNKRIADADWCLGELHTDDIAVDYSRNIADAAVAVKCLA